MPYFKKSMSHIGLVPLGGNDKIRVEIRIEFVAPTEMQSHDHFIFLTRYRIMELKFLLFHWIVADAGSYCWGLLLTLGVIIAADDCC